MFFGREGGACGDRDHKYESVVHAHSIHPGLRLPDSSSSRPDNGGPLRPNLSLAVALRTSECQYRI